MFMLQKAPEASEGAQSLKQSGGGLGLTGGRQNTESHGCTQKAVRFAGKQEKRAGQEENRGD